MARYTGPKNRIARRFGVNIFSRMRNPLAHKPNPPGQHGARRRKKSDYGIQLEGKQKLRAVYGMLAEKQLVSTYKKALLEAGTTAQVFLQKLECRLDNIVYRLKFATSIFGAQQLVSHGHILVNGKKVDRRSFLVRPGMQISVKEGSRQMRVLQLSLESGLREVPDYLAWDKEKGTGTLLVLPEMDQILGQLPVELNIPMICDFLAHQN